MSKQVQHATAPSDRVPWNRLIAYGFGGLIPIALFNSVGQLTQLMGNISLGISAFWLGVILIIPRLWDAVSDPLVGHMSDNCRSRFGRRRPFILIGAIGVSASFCALWWVPQGDDVSEVVQLSYILVSLVVFFTCCTVFEIPHGALGMEMSPDTHQRTRLFSAKSFFGNLFAMSTPWLFYFANRPMFKGDGNEVDGMRSISLVLLVVLIPMALWWFFSLRGAGFKPAVEKKEKRPFWRDMKITLKNKTFLTVVMIVFTLAMGFNFVAIFNYYISIYFLYGGDKVAAGPILGVGGTAWAITGLLAVFPLNWISVRVGKKLTMIIAILLMCSAQLSKIVCYDPERPYLILIPTVLLSTGMLFFFTLAASMVGDVCDEDDLETGTRSEGSYYSVFWWFIKMGTAFASIVTGLLILFTQFNEDQVRAVDSVSGSVTAISNKVTGWYEGGETPGAESLLKEIDDRRESAQKSNSKIAKRLKAETKEKLVSEYQRDFELNWAYLENLEQLREETGERFGSGPAPAPKEIQAVLLQLEYLKFQRDSEALDRILTEEIEAIPEKAESNTELLTTLKRLGTDLREALPQNDTLAALPRQEEERKNAWQKFVHWLKGKFGLVEEKKVRDSIALEAELERITEEAVSLSRQTSKTLFWMRAIEIGLPLVLSVVSLAFTFAYPLSEKRVYEIKALLEERKAEKEGAEG
jgi:GPH family glycoside/pentoside/hexuronide:cation symporter